MSEKKIEIVSPENTRVRFIGFTHSKLFPHMSDLEKDIWREKRELQRDGGLSIEIEDVVASRYRRQNGGEF